jgi:hypothetical protein
MLHKAQAYVARRRAEQQIAAQRAVVAERTKARAATLARALGGGVPTKMDAGPMAAGRLVVETRPVGSDGSLGEWQVHTDDRNLVVRQAESIMAQMAIGAANSALSYIELGDPTYPATPPALADLGLQQSTGQRKLGTVTASGNVVTVEVIFTTAEANGFTYTESGLFNGLLGAGLMFARKVFAGITKTAAFEMRFTWYITFLVNTAGGECAGISLIGPASVAAFTIYTAVGGEASVAATFDFTVGANNVDVFLNGTRQLPGNDYTEAGSGALNAPIGGPVLNKGVNLIAFVLNPGDEVFLIQRTLA